MMIEAVQQTGMESCVRAVEEILKYSFRNRKLLEDALTHRSFKGSASYERLEFLGDAAIGLAFTNFLYLSYPALDEGSLSLLRSVNLSNERLARVAVRHHFYRFVRHQTTVLADAVNEFILAVMEEDKIAVFGGAVKAPKVLADVVESIAAAVYIDCEFDLKAFWMVFRDILEPTITWEMVQEQPQPVTKLLQLCHKQRKQVHIKQWRENSDHFASVYVDDELVGSSSSAQRDMARLNAAREAVKNLEEMTMLVDEVTTVAFEVDDNNEIIAAKQKLHGICGSKKWPMPSYRVEKVEGASYDKSQRYVCSVQVKVGETVLLIHGDGRSRAKDAECSAASCMVYSLLESGYVQRRIDPKRMAIDKL